MLLGEFVFPSLVNMECPVSDQMHCIFILTQRTQQGNPIQIAIVSLFCKKTILLIQRQTILRRNVALLEQLLEFVENSRIRRKLTCNGKVYWNCKAFQEKGRAGCTAKQIPEGILESVTAEVLGLDSFDGEAFKDRIDRIEVPRANRLTFIFNDGHPEERVWKDRSRSESWTLEMREAARQRALKQRRNK